jgi:DNA-binding NtrC family response regulator
MDSPVKVLIVDDEPAQRMALAGMVELWGMKVVTATGGVEALEKISSFSPDVIVTDLKMVGMDGHALLARLQEEGDAPPTIALTAHGSIETAIKTMKDLGAYWFLEKPVQADVLQVLLRRGAAHHRLSATNRNLQRQLQYQGSLGELVGKSARMQEVFSLLQMAGPTNASVLISGESGTGKELVARTIHALNPKRQGPFFAINCAAIPETLIESELFGHEKGAFTGAGERRAG